MRFGLIGNPLGHSHSPYLQNLFGADGYELRPLAESELGAFMRERDFEGINVTIPYKRSVIPYLDAVDASAEMCGAVNTVVNRGGVLTGYNTDLYGMDFAMRAASVELRGKKVAVLGSGGTAHTACALAHLRGAARVTVVSRNGAHNYGNLGDIADTQTVINATPVGMYPHIAASPVDLNDFPAAEGVFDAVFNPLRTRLTQQADDARLKYGSGLLMLAAQAEIAAHLFTEGFFAPDITPERAEKITEAKRSLETSLSNVVLCGMPSSGKSTVGRLLAERLGKAFVDTDEEIERKTGRSIPEIFAEGGEAAFRAAERETVAECGMRQGAVIATGGGAPLDPENRKNLKANGVVFWLQRDLSALSTEGRPLSVNAENLRKMYEVRRPVYAAFADAEADNNGTPQDTAAYIAEEFYESTGHQRS